MTTQQATATLTNLMDIITTNSAPLGEQDLQDITIRIEVIDNRFIWGFCDAHECFITEDYLTAISALKMALTPTRADNAPAYHLA